MFDYSHQSKRIINNTSGRFYWHFDYF